MGTEAIYLTPDQPQQLRNKLQSLSGKIVSVYAGGDHRSSFGNSVCVSGKLEYNPERDKYRVLVSDGNYSYFEENVVLSIVYGTNGHTFSDGSEAVIRIEIKTDK